MPSREVPLSLLHERVNAWYAESGRKELPWRAPDASPWGVFLSEVMSQQTPLARVEPIWREWMQRWPTPTEGQNVHVEQAGRYTFIIKSDDGSRAFVDGKQVVALWSNHSARSKMTTPIPTTS